MQLKKLFTGFLILFSVSLFAETNPTDRKKEKSTHPNDSVRIGIDFLKKYIISPREPSIIAGQKTGMLFL